ncbi:aminopeptidase N [Novosphingobium chloroacetimidivorans]|uniref:Aminopeptidase n=1 Tax=Novosphingobium chloroacetimidivorans TaxID=1428314 RepID=A0A7W7K848_9SPHN|nr:M1 family metallopeptidase [Novosphingobium chloroacetimidivorans]MBB4857700.1 aminopeptidase N [Novosphingobium chloroacetimidivorans]
MRSAIRSFATASAVIALAVSLPALAAPASAPASTPVALPETVPSDLPRTARPTHYRIEVTPDAKALTFNGKVGVDLVVFTATDALTLHGNGLKIASAQLVAKDGKATPLTASADEKAQTLRFAAPAQIKPGTYRLDIAYTGTIGTQPSGLFALDYPDKRTGKDTRALFTQFEAPDARRFVPSFDEPSYKATFDLSAVVPASQMALSNMPVAREEKLAGNLKRVTFATTPKMSSYLLFFGLGDFERSAKMAADGVEVGIVSPAGSGAQADYARDGLAQILPWFDDYFGVKFPLPKLDNIAAPGSSQFFGAMENWGAIMTFERILLLDPATTSPDGIQDIYSTQAHETAHQWFGDLVTMAWWDDIWLNEGFASWAADKITDHFHPEWNYRLNAVDGREAAMSLDALPTTHPIVQTIRTVSEMEQAFDAITYQKGQATIAMLEDYAGADTWRAGIRAYMAKHAYANTQSKDLWAAIEGAGGKDVNRIAEAFTRTPGVPLLRVSSITCQGGQSRLSLTQDAFSLDPASRGGTKPVWPLPLLVRVGETAPARHLMTGKTDNVVLPGCGPVLVNSGQLGYYRTLYDAASLQKLVASFGKLAPIDQYGLVRDNLSLSMAGYQDMAAGLSLLSAVPASADATLTGNAVGLWQAVYDLLEKGEAQQQLGALISRTWSPRLQKLGFDPVAGEPLTDTKLRAQLIGTLGAAGDAAVVAEARRRLQGLATNPAALNGPLKRTWLDVAATNATPSDWELLRQQAAKATGVVDRQLYYSSLGAARDDALAAKTLDLAISGTPDATSGSQMITSVSRAHPEQAFDFVRAHQAQIDKLVEHAGRPRFISRLVAASTDPTMVDKLQAYAAALPADEAKPIIQAQTGLKQRLANRPTQRAQLAAWLKTQAR